MTRAHRFALFALSLIPNIVGAETTLLLTSREGWIEFVDPDSLLRIGHLPIAKLIESAHANTDGATLFVTMPRVSETEGCCALYAFDLQTKNLKMLIWPSRPAVVSPMSNRLFSQRGDVGIEVVDTRTLQTLPTIEAPGVYDLQPSPDGKWLFGTNTWRARTLDIFDVQQAKLVRRLRVPLEGPISGTGLGNLFYLYVSEQELGHLWQVSPFDVELREEVNVPFSGLPMNSADGFPTILGADGQLFIYQEFGTNLDRRSTSGAPGGGVYEIDPGTGSVIRSLAPGLHLARLVTSPDGEKLYGLDVESAAWKAVRLVKIDRSSSHLDAIRELGPGVRNISLEQIDGRLIPHQ